jgi:hypothetical protein
MKICFLGNIGSALNGNPAGGGEGQLALLAKTLSRAGLEVFVVDPNIEKDFITEDDVKVCSIPNWNSGIRIIRMFTHRIPSLYRLLKKIHADIYYIGIRNFYNIIPYLAAKKNNAKVVLAIMSDLDVLGFKARYKHHYSKNMDPYNWAAFAFPTEVVLPFLLRRADIVLVQHESQMAELKKKKIDSILFRNLIDVEYVLSNTSKEKKEGYSFVGALDIRKGFKEFTYIAENVNQRKFKVIGQPRDRGAKDLFEKIEGLPNIKTFGRLPHKEAINQIANSRALICTSAFEGFPNIFIEAWCTGTPVISLTVDPGGVIEREKLGKVFHGNIDQLIKYLNEDQWTFNEEHLKNYVQKNHSLESAKKNFFSNIMQVY